MLQAGVTGHTRVVVDHAGLLVLIGSGELGPRMARVQRDVVRRLAGGGSPGDVSAVVIDTTYGFQDNADALTGELLDFHRRRLGVAADVASLRRGDGDELDRETALARLREADLVFGGPGSPSYALRHWHDMPVASTLAERVARGGAVVFASAAAATVGRCALPVYEIYKAGADPHWLAGLDLLGMFGICVAVVPHWDNTEGAGHDTRYCFLGERRLRVLEAQLPPGTGLLGIDEHTALVVDVGGDSATVEGRGGVTLRVQGMETQYPAGTRLALDDLRGARDRAVAPQRTASVGASTATASGAADSLAARLLDARQEAAALAHDAQMVEPLVALLVELRAEARGRGDYATADMIRERLAELGVELADTPEGTVPRSGDAG